MNVFHPVLWRVTPFEDRMIALQELEEDYARMQGRAAYWVDDKDLGPDIHGKLGDGEIIVNSRFVSDTQYGDIPAFGAVKAVIHEGRHAFQLAVVGGHTVHENLIEVQKWKENFAAYIDARRMRPGYYYAYRFQPLERDAHDYATKEMKTIYGRLEQTYGRINSLAEYFENDMRDTAASADLAVHDLGSNFLERLDRLIHEDYERKVHREGPQRTEVSSLAEIWEPESRRSRQQRGPGPRQLNMFESSPAVKDKDGSTSLEPRFVLAQSLAEKLEKDGEISSRFLTAEANRVFGGTQGQGVYSPKDAFDAMEVAFNLHIAKTENPAWNNTDAEWAQNKARDLTERIGKLPTQSRRDEEMDEFQQFSTPPALAFVANWVANIMPRDVVLEPSAGTGDLAIWPKMAGAKVVLNELSERRRELLSNLFPQARLFKENAEQLHNVLPPDVSPTVIVMNPPFSASAGRLQGERDTGICARHIEQALKRLQDNGRLVAIAGQGMAADRPTFARWWKEIEAKYNVRANIGISGKEYGKYGTTFDNQILVIDKTGSTTESVLTGRVESVADLPRLLEGIKNDRERIKRSLDQPAVEKDSQKVRDSLRRSDQPGESRPDLGGDGTGSRGHTGSGRTDATGRSPEGKSGIGNDPDDENGPGRGEVRDRTRGDIGGGGSRDSGRDTGGGKGAGRVAIESIRGQASEFSESIFAQYIPQRLTISGAKQHPGRLVQSAAMSAVEPPAPAYSPTLPEGIIRDGLLSLAQLEAVVYAGQAHSGHLPSGKRKGFFIGDGTGVGKGREISGIILDNMMQGREKAVWISASGGLIEDAKRDFAGIGGDPEKIFSQGKTKAGGEILQRDGILFTTYATLASGEKRQANDQGQKAGKTRAEQITQWLGKDFDGVIAFDEAHSMGNAFPVKGKRGIRKPSQQAIAGVNLQNELPDARIVYVSATGATEISNLSYADRLGLWGEGTAFADVRTFIEDVSMGGIASMELISRDMKAMGMYLSRSLSYDGVSYERLEHTLSPLQEDIYNELAGAWQIVLNNVNEALEITQAGKDGSAKSVALSRFWGAHQRFFNQVITAMQTPRVIDDIREQLAAGNAAVIQLVNTNEAAQERIVADAVAKNAEIEDLDFTPRQMLIDYVRNGFPVAAYEQSTDADGKIIYVPVRDSEGNQVFDRDAIALRDGLIETLQQIRVPENPLDSIINAFGSQRVAEVTGRSRRFVQVRDDEGNLQVIEEKRGKNASMADAASFQNDRKDILVFSGAGGTGYSFHADNTAQNQRKRIHYILQPGWRADSAVQGFGRTHRTNQAHEPHYVLPTTNLQAQKRFVSSIARRLDQLGALTRGQREATSQGLFTASDNLESEYASIALKNLFKDLYGDRTSLSFQDVTKQMGLSLIDPDGGFDEGKIPSIPQFLNRLLSLKTDMQNAVFGEFEERLIEAVQYAKQHGFYDEGLQTIKALSIVKIRDDIVFEEKNTGAKTRYVELAVTNRVEYEDWKDAKSRSEKRREKGDLSGWFVSEFGKTKGEVFYLRDIGHRINAEGNPVRRGTIYSIRKNDPKYIDNVDEIDQGAYKFVEGRYQKVTLARRIREREAEKLWREQIANAPKTVTKTERMIVGVIVPIWDRVEGSETIKRLQTDDGEQLLGRVLGLKAARETLRNLGVGSNVSRMSSQDLFSAIKSGRKAILSNGWEISTAKVNFEDRIEIKGRVSFTYAEERLLKEQGAFIERINWAERVFIPTGENGLAAFERIIASKPVIDLLEKARGRRDEGIDPESELEYGISSTAGLSEKGDKRMAKYTVLALDQRTQEEVSLGDFDEAKDAYGAFITAVESTPARVLNEEGAVLADIDAGRFPVFHDPELEALHREVNVGFRGPAGPGASYHEKVAAKLISLLERNLAPWQKQWKPGEKNFGLPHNPVSGTRYKGANMVLLAAEAIEKGYQDPRWLTFKQAQQIGARVNAGEKGTRVEYWKFEERRRLLDEDGQPVRDKDGNPVLETIEKLRRPKMFAAVVFNAEQIRDMPALEEKAVTWSPDERAESILKNSGAKIFHDQADRAFYRQGTDTIHLPDQSQFDSVEAYYAVALHELSHWTGEKSRLDRDLTNPFGSIGYAKEELRAEISSFMLGEELRIGHDPENHAAYVKSWIKILQDDPKELFRASAAAEKIMDYVLGFEIEKEQEVNLVTEEKTVARESEGRSPAMDGQGIEAGKLRRAFLTLMSQPNDFHLTGDKAEAFSQSFNRIIGAIGDYCEPYAGLLENPAVYAQDFIWDRLEDAGAKERLLLMDKNAVDAFVEREFGLQGLLKCAHPACREDVLNLHEFLGYQESKSQKTLLASKDTYIAVPYVERMEAKALGARWNKEAKSWYVPKGHDLTAFERWTPNAPLPQKTDPLREFATALSEAGLKLEGPPLMDGKLHRVPVEGDRAGGRSGAYRAFLDGRPAGMIQNWKTGYKERWKSNGAVLSAEERANLLAEAAQKRIDRQNEMDRLQEQKAIECAARLSSLDEASPDHPYLARKGVGVYGLYVNNSGDLVVPLKDAQGKLWSLQRIKENGEKPFEKDARKQGCFHTIGELRHADEILIAEGYATGVSVYEATGRPVVLALDSGNLLSVAKSLHETYPAKHITILGDDDRHLPDREPPLPNVGREKAIEAAREVEGNAIFPTFLESENGADFTDFNDLARNRGLETVFRQIEFELERGKTLVEEVERSNERDLQHEQDRGWEEQETEMGMSL